MSYYQNYSTKSSYYWLFLFTDKLSLDQFVCVHADKDEAYNCVIRFIKNVLKRPKNSTHYVTRTQAEGGKIEEVFHFPNIDWDSDIDQYVFRR